MRVAVTGATGFVGRAIASRLVDDGHEVVALSRSAGGRLPPGVQRALGDLSDSGSLLAFADDAELVIHAAGLVRSRDVPALHRTNVEGSVALANALRPGVSLVH